MRISFSRNLSEPPYGALFSLVFLFGGLLFYFSYPFLPYQMKRCAFHEMTGIPCPTCGATRAGFAMMRGDVVHAFFYNPLLVAAGVGLAAWGVASLILEILGKRRIVFQASAREKRLLRWTAAALFLVNWGWLIYSGI